MVHRYRAGRPPSAAPDPDAEPLVTACRAAPDETHEALADFDFDFDRAVAAVWRLVEETDGYLRRAKPWELAGRRLDAVLAALLAGCRALANQLTPFVPALALRIADQCFALSGSVAQPRTLFPKLRPTTAIH